MTEHLLNKVNLGDCLVELKKLPDNCVDSVVTDPPYGLQFMNKHWDYDVPKAEVWAEVLRVLKPGGYLLSFFGTRTYHRGVIQIEDAGFEIRDQLAWIYGSGFPKSHNLTGEHQGKGTALKPAQEPIVMARKAPQGIIADNVAKWGTGALNIDACRIKIDEAIDAGQLRTMNREAREGQDGWGMSTKGGDTPEVLSAAGRWPANVLHDGSSEVLAAFPDAPGQMATSRADGAPMNNQIYGALNHGTVPMEPREDSTQSAARFFYCAKASKKDRDEDLAGLPVRTIARSGGAQGAEADGEDYEACQGIGLNKIVKAKNHHPTVKPTELMQYLCRLVTPPHGIVLDPYAGSGSTGKAALLECLSFIGFEREAEYIEIANARMKFIKGQDKLF